MFAIEIRSRCTLAGGGANGARNQAVHLDASGELEIVVAARRGDEIGAVARLVADHVDIGSGGQAAEPDTRRRYVEALAAGVELWMRSDGATLGLRFPQDSASEHRALWISAIAALRFVVPGGAAEWEQVEVDATGTADVVYHWADDGGLEKSKLAYHVPSDGSRVPQVVGGGTARFDAAAGWLAEVDYREVLRLVLHEAELDNTVDFVTSCRLVSSGRVEPLPEFDWNGGWQTGCGDAGVAGEELTRAAIARYLDGARVTDLVDRIEAVLRNGGDPGQLTEAIDLLLWLIRLDDRPVEELQPLVFDPTTASSLSVALLDALGGAGTEAAQALLGRMVGDAALTEERRVIAAQAMFQLSEPGAAARAAANRLAADSAAAPELRGTGLLLAGALSRRPGGADQAAWLLAFGPRAEAEGLIVDWLGALGNAGVAGAIPAADRHLNDPDPRVRLAALDAVRRVPDAAAAHVLERGVLDPEPVVRGRAAELLASRASGALLERIDQLIHGEDSELVCSSALRGLARRVSEPAVRALVERVADGDRPARVRELARKLLGRGS